MIIKCNTDFKSNTNLLLFFLLFFTNGNYKHDPDVFPICGCFTSAK